MKKLLLWIVVVILSVSVITAVAAGAKLQFAYVSKTIADPMFSLCFDGFKEACDEVGIEAIYRGSEIAAPEKEIEILNQLIAQGIDGIGLIPADFDALQPICEKAIKNGIPVVTNDSAANPKCRVVHVEVASSEDIGREEMRAAYEIAGGEGVIGILSAQPQSFSHGVWCGYMKKEVEENPEKYKNITLLDVVYGEDVPEQSTLEAQALLQNHPDLKVIIAPTTVGILAAAKVIQDQGSSVKVTGLGMPSEMAPYIENGICPWMYLWSPMEQGYMTAEALINIVNGTITGKIGDVAKCGKMGDREVLDYGDGGTYILMGPMMKFDINNIAEWKKIF
jgi:rhamnose transport system substrate-binding protein